MRPKLLIVLGAGASDKYGPSTRWLTERLLTSGSGAPGALLFRRVDTVLKRRRAYNQRQSLLDSPQPDPNFEELIQAVDDIATHMGGSDSLLSPFVRFNGSLRPLKPALERYRRYASRAREFIMKETKQHCDGSSDPRDRPIVKALALLAERSHLRLMSLNYDDLPESADIDFHTGFVDAPGAYQTFQPLHPWPDDRHLWCQLHGSLFFRVRKSQYGQFEIVRYRNRREAARRRWIDDPYWARYADGHIAGLSPMITGLRKSDAIQDEPFANYAHQFRAEALSCDRWLIVGYGGGDPHINAVLSQARMQWRRTGRAQRVLVVGYYKHRSACQFGSLVFDRDPDWEGGRSLWLFDDDDFSEFSNIAAFRPQSVSRWNDTLGLTLDGVDWAMGPGLPAVMRFLGI